VFTSVSFDHHKRIMPFLDMQAEEMVTGEVLAAFETAIRMKAAVVLLVLGVRPESEGFLVRRHGALDEWERVFLI
jgi:hypothetical protein